jgi:transposase
MNEGMKRAIGIDLGKRMMEVRILVDGEKMIAWSGRTDEIGRKKLYSKLGKGDRVGIEACALAFTIAKEIIQRTKAEVVVLNPGRLAMIYKSNKKTDSEDALKIARIIQRNPREELPEVTIPTEWEENARALVKEIGFLKQERTRYINRLHSMFTAVGITTIKKANLQTKERRREFMTLLSGIYIGMATRNIDTIDTVEKQIDDLEREQIRMLNENELASYALSMPGVGPATALAFLAYVGDGSRFSRASEVSNYVGLVPKVDISCTIVKYGHITKEGCNPIRRVVVQGAWSMLMTKNNCVLKDKYYKIADRRGKRIAIVATARKMVELLYILVKNRCYFWDTDEKQLRLKFKKYKIEHSIKFEGSAA